MKFNFPFLLLLATKVQLGAGGTSCSTGQLQCVEDGTMYCVSPSHYGLCNRGCMIPQPVAPGTHCTGNPGVIAMGDADTRVLPSISPGIIEPEGKSTTHTISPVPLSTNCENGEPLPMITPLVSAPFTITVLSTSWITILKCSLPHTECSTRQSSSTQYTITSICSSNSDGTVTISKTVVMHTDSAKDQEQSSGSTSMLPPTDQQGQTHLSAVSSRPASDSASSLTSLSDKGSTTRSSTKTNEAVLEPCFVQCDIPGEPCTCSSISLANTESAAASNNATVVSPGSSLAASASVTTGSQNPGSKGGIAPLPTTITSTGVDGKVTTIVSIPELQPSPAVGSALTSSSSLGGSAVIPITMTNADGQPTTFMATLSPIGDGELSMLTSVTVRLPDGSNSVVPLQLSSITTTLSDGKTVVAFLPNPTSALVIPMTDGAGASSNFTASIISGNGSSAGQLADTTMLSNNTKAFTGPAIVSATTTPSNPSQTTELPLASTTAADGLDLERFNNTSATEVSFGKDIWNGSKWEIGCRPPCCAYLPPLPLSTPITTDWGLVTTSLISLEGTGSLIPVSTWDLGTRGTFTICTREGGKLVEKQTVITPKLLTITEVALPSVCLADQTTGIMTYHVSDQQRVLPPKMTITLNPGELWIQPKHIGTPTPNPSLGVCNSTGIGFRMEPTRTIDVGGDLTVYPTPTGVMCTPGEPDCPKTPNDDRDEDSDDSDDSDHDLIALFGFCKGGLLNLGWLPVVGGAFRLVCYCGSVGCDGPCAHGGCKFNCGQLLNRIPLVNWILQCQPQAKEGSANNGAPRYPTRTPTCQKKVVATVTTIACAPSETGKPLSSCSAVSSKLTTGCKATNKATTIYSTASCTKATATHSTVSCSTNSLNATACTGFKPEIVTGCSVENSVTTQFCSLKTVTDVTAFCHSATGSVSANCTSTTTNTATGCEVTATTTSIYAPACPASFDIGVEDPFAMAGAGHSGLPPIGGATGKAQCGPAPTSSPGKFPLEISKLAANAMIDAFCKHLPIPQMMQGALSPENHIEVRNVFQTFWEFGPAGAGFNIELMAASNDDEKCRAMKLEEAVCRESLKLITAQCGLSGSHSGDIAGGTVHDNGCFAYAIDLSVLVSGSRIPYFDPFGLLPVPWFTSHDDPPKAAVALVFQSGCDKADSKDQGCEHHWALYPTSTDFNTFSCPFYMSQNQTEPDQTYQHSGTFTYGKADPGPNSGAPGEAPSQFPDLSKYPDLHWDFWDSNWGSLCLKNCVYNRNSETVTCILTEPCVGAPNQDNDIPELWSFKCSESKSPMVTCQTKQTGSQDTSFIPVRWCDGPKRETCGEHKAGNFFECLHDVDGERWPLINGRVPAWGTKLSCKNESPGAGSSSPPLGWAKDGISRFCNALDEKPENNVGLIREEFFKSSDSSYTHIRVERTDRRDCKGQTKKDACNIELLRIQDKCSHGGTVEDLCLSWTVDLDHPASGPTTTTQTQAATPTTSKVPENPSPTVAPEADIKNYGVGLIYQSGCQKQDSKDKDCHPHYGLYVAPSSENMFSCNFVMKQTQGQVKEEAMNHGNYHYGDTDPVPKLPATTFPDQQKYDYLAWDRWENDWGLGCMRLCYYVRKEQAAYCTAFLPCISVPTIYKFHCTQSVTPQFHCDGNQQSSRDSYFTPSLYCNNPVLADCVSADNCLNQKDKVRWLLIDGQVPGWRQDHVPPAPKDHPRQVPDMPHGRMTCGGRTPPFGKADWIIPRITAFCNRYREGRLFGPGMFRHYRPGLQEGTHTYLRFEVKQNCEWSFKKSDCESQLKSLLDKCPDYSELDITSHAGKKGGVLENNCLIWTLETRVTTGFNHDTEDGKFDWDEVVAPPAPPPPPPRPANVPDFPHGRTECGKGKKGSVHKEEMVKDVEGWCSAHKDGEWNDQGTNIHNPGPNTKHFMRITVKKDCRWDWNQQTCKDEYKKIIDKCPDQGGVSENNCTIFEIRQRMISDDPIIP